MLKTLDILIGFTLVMLIMSMAVTLATQVVTSTLNLRGRSLRQGVANVLALLDRRLTPADAKQLANYLLRDPLVATANLFGSRSLAPVIHREELTKLLLEFAAANDANWHCK